jgi:hypothetical protein
MLYTSCISSFGGTDKQFLLYKFNKDKKVNIPETGRESQ